MLTIEQTLRRTHRLHDAATAALAAATRVQAVAQQAHVDLPDDDVTRVARAAAQLARGLVVGDHPGVDDALQLIILLAIVFLQQFLVKTLLQIASALH